MRSRISCWPFGWSPAGIGSSGEAGWTRCHRPGPVLILHEDDDLLVVRKPAGINTHSSSFHAGEALATEWLKRREPRWSELAILQRLDKETSGVLVFSKRAPGNVSRLSSSSPAGGRKRSTISKPIAIPGAMPGRFDRSSGKFPAALRVSMTPMRVWRRSPNSRFSPAKAGVGGS